MTPIRLRSEADFRVLLVSVISDAQEASFHWRLHRLLRASIRRYVRELNEANAFWSLTINAHRDAALFRVARLYDPYGGLGLPVLLDTIAHNLSMFDERSFRARLKDNPFVNSLAAGVRPPAPSQLRKDAVSVSSRDRLVLKLLDLRNQELAHRDPRVVVGRIASPRLALSDRQLGTLIGRAGRIVNKYSILFVAGSHLMRLMGDDDYLKVLEAMRERTIAWTRRFREELTVAGGGLTRRRTRE